MPQRGEKRRHRKSKFYEVKRVTGATGDSLGGDRPGARGSGGPIALLDALRRHGPMSVDHLVAETGQHPGVVLHSLGGLEAEGRVVSSSDGEVFALAPRPAADDRKDQKLA